MNKTSLWIVVVVTAVWIGFLLGYAVSAHTGDVPGASRGREAASKEGGTGASAGGYGK